MPENKRVHFIPSIPKREKRVGIYCRVSTNSMEQLQSLTAQVSHLTRITAATPQWLLADVYMDIATSKTGSSRKEFNRMLEDCQTHKLDIVITKNISRFGRDTVAENEFRSENIKWGIKNRAASGKSKLYDRKCYGYRNDKTGHLVIDEETAKNVKLIFDLYLSRQSVLGIIKELERRKISSPTGKEKWCKRTIDVMLSNEKYTGDVKLLKSGNSEIQYLSTDNNPAIISKETYEAVQIQKARRSNVVKDEKGKRRKSTKYSSK